MQMRHPLKEGELKTQIFRSRCEKKKVKKKRKREKYEKIKMERKRKMKFSRDFSL